MLARLAILSVPVSGDRPAEKELSSRLGRAVTPRSLLVESRDRAPLVQKEPRTCYRSETLGPEFQLGPLPMNRDRTWAFRGTLAVMGGTTQE